MTSVPSGPLILLVASALLSPAIESPSTETIVSPAIDPGLLGGRAVEDLNRPQAAL